MVPRTHIVHNREPPSATIVSMPELPDLDILADAFTAALVGRPIVGSRTVQSLVLRGTTAELEALVGQRLRSVLQRGKFLVLELDRDRLVINAMLTGRLGLAPPGARAYAQTAFVLVFGPRVQPPDAIPAWTQGAGWLPEEDATIELRYRDPTRMGKVYVLPEGLERPVAGWDEQGPDVDDPGLDLDAWRTRISRHGGELKNLLKNQAFVAGVGNGYSDEILWAARLAPFRKRSSLATEEVDRLYQASRDVPAWAAGELRRRVPPRFEVEVRDFLRVHGKGGQACPRCGSTITEISPGGFVTSWCRSCQR
jgi:formamidopyrimidine-DNA glycosylase